SAEVAALPLQRVEATATVHLNAGINPAWRAALEEFRAAVVAPLLGPDQVSLSEAGWTSLKDRFAPIATWSAAKKGTAVEKLARSTSISAAASSACGSTIRTHTPRSVC